MFTEEIYDICGILEEGCKEARRYLDTLSPTKHAVGEEVIYEESLHEVLATFNQGVNPDRSYGSR